MYDFKMVIVKQEKEVSKPIIVNNSETLTNFAIQIKPVQIKEIGIPSCPSYPHPSRAFKCTSYKN